MLIGKLIKPCKICIYEQKSNGGEIESFTLLKLSLHEMVQLLDVAKNKENCLDGSVVIKYSGDDEVHQTWKKIAVDHRKLNPQEFLDVSKTFKTKITGTSCLIRDPVHHIIRIALRKGDDKVSINRICIDNSIRERFFNDVKMTVYYQRSKTYSMSSEDLNIYSYWSKYMNTSYISQLQDHMNK